MKLMWDLFSTFFKLGIFTFGGGMAMLPLIRDLVVEKKQWLTDDEVVDCFAVCQALPGVIAINTATYIGKKRAGLKGSLAASIGVMLPSFIIIIVIILLLGAINENPYVNGAFEGIKAASTGLILYAAYKLGQQVMKNKITWFIGIVSFLIIVLLDVTALWGIIFGGVMGYITYLYEEYRRKKRGETK
ncbi:chromate transporter [Anaerovorax odorimutans]|uniref:chromate transporter n=1 Tax=Anaerovorax odorimutans TaxID=109327 RepID=UPI000413B1DC|nr:chromate transporter [Anaerovorax odorimutans]